MHCLSFRVLLAGAAALTTLAASPTAGAEELFEKCHLLCTNEAGRTVSSNADPELFEHFLFRLETVPIRPLGGYDSRGYRRMRSGSTANAVELLPSVVWRPSRDWAAIASFPQEWNRSTGVVLPTLHAENGSRGELAPGRLSLQVAHRFPGLRGAPWLGLGYALSDPIGTAPVRDDIAANPDLGLEALGIGTDDVFTTADTAVFENATFGRVRAGGELRAHTLPRLGTLYGVTLGYHVALDRPISPRVDLGLRISGFRTEVVSQRTAQMNAIVATPTARLHVTEHASVALGVSTEVPGSWLNENSLQTVSGHLILEAGF